MRRAVTILASFVAVICTPPAFGCSCGGWPSVAEARQEAVAVFEGTVIRKEPVLASTYGSWFVVERWTFAIERSWKGPAGYITISEGYSNCSLRFSLGERAIVFAHQHEEASGLGAYKCATPRGSPEDMVRALGPPNLVGPRGTASESSPARAVRHARVYGLISLALVRNVVVRRESSGLGFGAVALFLSLFILAIALIVALVLRRRASYVALVVACALLLSSVYLVGRDYTRGGYFGHLVE